MNKLISILFFIFVGLFAKAQPADITVYFPPKMEPGHEYLIKVTIDNYTLQNFAELSVGYVDGMQINASQTAGAQVKDYGNVFKFYWDVLPVGKTLEVSYILKVDKLPQQGFETKVLLTYLVNGQRGEATVSVHYKIRKEGNKVFALKG